MDFLHHALSSSGYTVKKYKDHLRVSAGNEIIGGWSMPSVKDAVLGFVLGDGQSEKEIIKDNSGQTVGAGLVKPIVINNSNKIGGNLKKKIVADRTQVVVGGNIVIGGSVKKKALQKKYCF